MQAESVLSQVDRSMVLLSAQEMILRVLSSKKTTQKQKRPIFIFSNIALAALFHTHQVVAVHTLFLVVDTPAAADILFPAADMPVVAGILFPEVDTLAAEDMHRVEDNLHDAAER